MSDSEAEEVVSDVEDVEEEDEVKVTAGSARKQRKYKYRAQLEECLNEYKSILLVNVDNVGSKQLQSVRIALRGRGRVLMGKNTIIRKVLRDLVPEKPQLEGLLPFIKGNMGFIFSNGDLFEIRKEVLLNKVPAAARSGAVAPIDVWVPPGPTGLDPGQTAFFQALNIATKISKGAIEILSKVHLIKKNEKVTASAVSLLGKLNIRPFFFGISVNTVYDNGDVYDAAIMDLTDDLLFQKWYRGVAHVAAMSLQLGHPTAASISHSIKNGFKKMLAIAFTTEFTFPKAEEFKAGASSGGGDDDDDDEEEEEEEEESEDEEEETDGNGLFD